MARHLGVSPGSRPHMFSLARAEWPQKRDTADGTHLIGIQWSSTLSWARAGSRNTSCTAIMTRLHRGTTHCLTYTGKDVSLRFSTYIQGYSPGPCMVFKFCFCCGAESHYLAQAGLEHTILLRQLPEYRCVISDMTCMFRETIFQRGHAIYVLIV